MKSIYVVIFCSLALLSFTVKADSGADSLVKEMYKYKIADFEDRRPWPGSCDFYKKYFEESLIDKEGIFCSPKFNRYGIDGTDAADYRGTRIKANINAISVNPNTNTTKAVVYSNYFVFDSERFSVYFLTKEAEGWKIEVVAHEGPGSSFCDPEVYGRKLNESEKKTFEKICVDQINKMKH